MIEPRYIDINGRRFINITGQRFGSLVAVSPATSPQRPWHWLFRCDCGVETKVDGAAVRALKTRSCGCLRRKVNRAPCCKQCNIAKRDTAYDDFIEWIARAYHHLKGA